jgi:small GTP-binding protein
VTDSDVGKTSIIQVLIHGTFQEKMSNTLGACFHRYECDDGKGEPIVMDLWDTAGQEKFRSLLTLYYKNSDAVVIVFDVTDPQSFQTVDYWTRQIETNCESMPCKADGS